MSLKGYNKGYLSTKIRPRGYKTWVHSQTQNKAQWLAACGHVSAISQSMRFILSLRLYSSFITSRPVVKWYVLICVTMYCPIQWAYTVARSNKNFFKSVEIIKEVKFSYLFLNHHLRISVIQMDLLPYPEKIQIGKNSELWNYDKWYKCASQCSTLGSKED